MNRRNFLKVAVGAALVPAAPTFSALPKTNLGVPDQFGVSSIEEILPALRVAKTPVLRPQFVYVLQDALRKEWDEHYNSLKKIA